MKVTFVVANYAPSVGGAQTYVRRVAEGLAAEFGHQVEVLTSDALRRPSSPDPGSIPIRSEVVGGVSVRRYPVARRAHALLRLLRRIGRRAGLGRSGGVSMVDIGPLGLRLHLAILRAVRSADAVVSVTVPTLTAWSVAHGGRGAARIVTPLLHLNSPDPIGAASLRVLGSADGCTALTYHERDWLVARGVAPGGIAVLPPGCDPDEYDDVDPPTARGQLGLPERPTVGYVGRMAAYKGVECLLDAMERVWATAPDTTLLLAGSRSGWGDFDRVVERVRPLAGERLVIRSGFDDDERAAVFGACDVVAFPSREESFGMVTVEAWCARRAVVAADIPVVRELITPGVDGELVPVGDVAALAGTIESLLADPGRRARLGAAGRRRAESEFGWGEIVEGWDAHLSRAVTRQERQENVMAGDRR